MTIREQQALLQSAQPPGLLHVMPAEVFTAVRILSLLDVSDYESAFLDRAGQIDVRPLAAKKPA